MGYMKWLSKNVTATTRSTAPVVYPVLGALMNSSAKYYCLKTETGLIVDGLLPVKVSNDLKDRIFIHERWSSVQCLTGTGEVLAE